MWSRRAPPAAGSRVTFRLPGLFLCQMLLTGLFAVPASPGADPDLPPEFYPEHHQVDALLETNPPPHGVLLLIRNEREDALTELLPRARYYAALLGDRLSGLHVSVISYGPELVALAHRSRPRYPGLQEQAVALARLDHVDVHLCGAFASERGLGASDFPAELDVVPSSTALYQDYRMLGYEAVVLQPAW